jgi:hypothetical protein
MRFLGLVIVAMWLIYPPARFGYEGLGAQTVLYWLPFYVAFGLFLERKKLAGVTAGVMRIPVHAIMGAIIMFPAYFVGTALA